LPIGAVFGFLPLPGSVRAAVGVITGLYVLVSELAKYIFFGRFSKRYR
jgi:hypothetical protein